jgi:hypothetical protein
MPLRTRPRNAHLNSAEPSLSRPLSAERESSPRSHLRPESISSPRCGIGLAAPRKVDSSIFLNQTCFVSLERVPRQRLDSSTVGLFDGDIRAALIRLLQEQDPTAAIVEELPLLRGRGRADIAFINGELCGYEIKSEHDSLVRLGTQTDQYQSLFEFITLVVTRKHLDLARKRIPKSWGIMLAERMDTGTVHLSLRRAPQKNCRPDPKVLVRVLWKQECRRVLTRAGIHVPHEAPVIELWQRIETLPLKMLCSEVRLALKARQRKPAQLQIRYDDSPPIEPTESARRVLQPGLAPDRTPHRLH